MKKDQFVYLIILVLGTTNSTLVYSQKNASLPYSVVHRMLNLDSKKGEDYPNPNALVTVSSDVPEVSPADIKLYIDSQSGRIPLEVSKDGTFLLPLSKNLLREDPMIVANQPKGTLNLNATVGVEGKIRKNSINPKEGKIRYSALFVLEKTKTDLLKQLNNRDNQSYKTNNVLMPPTIAEFTPKKDAEKAKVFIETKEGLIRVFPNNEGSFILSYNPALMKEDPWILLSKNHNWSIQTRVKE